MDDTQDKGGLMASATPSNGEALAAAGPSSQTALTRASLFIKTNLKKGVGLLQPDLQTGQHLEEGSGKLQGSNSIQDAGDQYLQREVAEARDLIAKLGRKTDGAQSFREKNSKMLEEAHRAMGRLEQAVYSGNKAGDDLFLAVSEIKASVRRGLTLVDVYGSYSTLAKVATLVMRKNINAKYDKVIQALDSLLQPKPLTLALSGTVGSATLDMAQRMLSGTPGISGSFPLTSAGSALLPASSASTGGGVNASISTLASVGPRGSDRERDRLRDTSQPLGRSSRGMELLMGKDPCSAGGPSNKDFTPLITGLVIKERGERIHCVAFVPLHLTGAYLSVWWSAGSMLHFYTAAGQSTTDFQVDKEASVVTAIGIDDTGNIWTGHLKGLVRMRQRLMWENHCEDKAFSSAVRIIVFDDEKRAWIGDDAGRVKVLRHRERRTGSIDAYGPAGGGRPSLQMASPPTSGSITLLGHPGDPAVPSSLLSTLGVGDGSGSISRSRLEVVATLQQSLLSKMADSTRTFLFGRLGGGASRMHSPRDNSNSDSTSGKAVSSSSSPSTEKHDRKIMSEGPIRAILVREKRAWIAGGPASGQPWLAMYDTSTFNDIDVCEVKQFGPVNAIHALSWPQHTAGPGPRTRTSSSGTQPKELTTSSSRPPCSWRLLTGHDCGQLLLWHPAATRLAPLIRIGEPFSPIKGIMVFEEQALIVTGHQNGELHVFVQPRTEVMVPPGSESTHASSLGTFRPRKITIRAHKSQLTSMLGTGGAVVTTSILGTMRMWHAEDVARDVERAGLNCDARPAGGTGNALRRASATTDPDLAPTSSNASSVPASSLPRVGSGPTHHPSLSATHSSPLAQGHTPHHAHTSSTPSHLGGLQAVPSTSDRSTGVNIPGIDERPSDGMARESRGDPSVLTTAQTRGSSMGTPMSEGQAAVEAPMQNSDSSAPAPVSGTGAHVVLPSAPSATAPAGPIANFGTVQTIEANELLMRKQIGAGAFGRVWLAEWLGCAVAVKELTGFSDPTDARAWQDMQNEVHMLGTYNHPNIMRFMAVCLSPPAIVMQYYPHGSLFDLLSQARNGKQRAIRELTWGKRLDMLRDIAAGMHYLHTRKPPVIHGDLRSPNLLLDMTIDREKPRFHVKIADFGLARMLSANSSMIIVSKTTNPRWTAPEVIKNSVMGPAGDVYSFAVVMWEMLTWRQPYETMMSVQVIFNAVTDNQRPDMPEDDSELPGNPGVTLAQYKALMEHCWAPDHKDRPTFREIVDVIQSMREMEARSHRAAAAAAASAGSATPGAAATMRPALSAGSDMGSIPSNDPTSHGHPGPSTPVVYGATNPNTASNSNSSVKSSDVTAMLAVAGGSAGVGTRAGVTGLLGAKDSASSMLSHPGEAAAPGMHPQVSAPAPSHLNKGTIQGSYLNKWASAAALGWEQNKEATPSTTDPSGGGQIVPYNPSAAGFAGGFGGAMTPIVEEQSAGFDSRPSSSAPQLPSPGMLSAQTSSQSGLPSLPIRGPSAPAAPMLAGDGLDPGAVSDRMSPGHALHAPRMMAISEADTAVAQQPGAVAPVSPPQQHTMRRGRGPVPAAAVAAVVPALQPAKSPFSAQAQQLGISDPGLSEGGAGVSAGGALPPSPVPATSPMGVPERGFNFGMQAGYSGFEQKTIGVHSFIGSIGNLLQGDDAVDPLEAYRSGALNTDAMPGSLIDVTLTLDPILPASGIMSNPMPIPPAALGALPSFRGAPRSPSPTPVVLLPPPPAAALGVPGAAAQGPVTGSSPTQGAGSAPGPDGTAARYPFVSATATLHMTSPSQQAGSPPLHEWTSGETQVPSPTPLYPAVQGHTDVMTPTAAQGNGDAAGEQTWARGGPAPGQLGQLLAATAGAGGNRSGRWRPSSEPLDSSSNITQQAAAPQQEATPGSHGGHTPAAAGQLPPQPPGLAALVRRATELDLSKLSTSPEGAVKPMGFIVAGATPPVVQRQGTAADPSAPAPRRKSQLLDLSNNSGPLPALGGIAAIQGLPVAAPAAAAPSVAEAALAALRRASGPGAAAGPGAHNPAPQLMQRLQQQPVHHPAHVPARGPAGSSQVHASTNSLSLAALAARSKPGSAAPRAPAGAAADGYHPHAGHSAAAARAGSGGAPGGTLPLAPYASSSGRRTSGGSNMSTSTTTIITVTTAVPNTPGGALAPQSPFAAAAAAWSPDMLGSGDHSASQSPSAATEQVHHTRQHQGEVGVESVGGHERSTADRSTGGRPSAASSREGTQHGSHIPTLPGATGASSSSPQMMGHHQHHDLAVGYHSHSQPQHHTSHLQHSSTAASGHLPPAGGSAGSHRGGSRLPHAHTGAAASVRHGSSTSTGSSGQHHHHGGHHAAHHAHDHHAHQHAAPHGRAVHHRTSRSFDTQGSELASALSQEGPQRASAGTLAHQHSRAAAAASAGRWNASHAGHAGHAHLSHHPHGSGSHPQLTALTRGTSAASAAGSSSAGSSTARTRACASGSAGVGAGSTGATHHPVSSRLQPHHSATSSSAVPPGSYAQKNQERVAARAAAAAATTSSPAGARSRHPSNSGTPAHNPHLHPAAQGGDTTPAGVAARTGSLSAAAGHLRVDVPQGELEGGVHHLAQGDGVQGVMQGAADPGPAAEPAVVALPPPPAGGHVVGLQAEQLAGAPPPRPSEAGIMPCTPEHPAEPHTVPSPAYSPIAGYSPAAFDAHSTPHNDLPAGSVLHTAGASSAIHSATHSAVSSRSASPAVFGAAGARPGTQHGSNHTTPRLVGSTSSKGQPGTASSRGSMHTPHQHLATTGGSKGQSPARQLSYGTPAGAHHTPVSHNTSHSSVKPHAHGHTPRVGFGSSVPTSRMATPAGTTHHAHAANSSSTVTPAPVGVTPLSLSAHPSGSVRSYRSQRSGVSEPTESPVSTPASSVRGHGSRASSPQRMSGGFMGGGDSSAAGLSRAGSVRPPPHTRPPTGAAAAHHDAPGAAMGQGGMGRGESMLPPGMTGLPLEAFGSNVPQQSEPLVPQPAPNTGASRTAGAGASASATAGQPAPKYWAPLNAYSPFASHMPAAPAFDEQGAGGVAAASAASAAAGAEPGPSASAAPAQPQQAKYWAPLSARSPFSGEAAPAAQPTAAPAPAVPQAASTSTAVQEGAPKYYAPLSKLSPFSAASSPTPTTTTQPQQAPPGAAATGPGAEGRPYAPLTARSPFAAPAPLAPVAPPPAAGTEGRPYAPLSALSPFSAAAAPQAAPPEGRPYAPLTARSPFSAAPAAAAAAAAAAGEPPAPVTGYSASTSGVASGAAAASTPEGRPYAPLTAFAPFSAAPAAPVEALPLAPAGTAAAAAAAGTLEGRPYAPLTTRSPFAALPAPAAVQPPVVVPTPSAGAAVTVQGRPYAPLSASSPFSSAAAPVSFAAQDSREVAPGGMGSEAASKPYAPMSRFSPFAQ